MSKQMLALNFASKSVVIIGGGAVGFHRATLLLDAGATVEVISPEFCSDLDQLAKSSDLLTLNKRKVEKSEKFAEAFLLVIATDNSELNQSIANSAGPNQLVNASFDASFGNVEFPAVVKRGPLLIGIVSGVPALTKWVRAQLEAQYSISFANVAKAALAIHLWLKKHQSIENRKRFWPSWLKSQEVKQLEADHISVDQALEHAKSQKPSQPVGEVFLVGAGPGDPGLLTFKAMALIQQADIVFYDRLVSDEIMSMLPRDVKKINVGKARDQHLVPQGQINQLLLENAQKGLRVLRLKGGDPFIFGRGGEELDLLQQHNIDFQVVPGITAASGCSAYSGIPLTHRDYSQSVRFITARLKDGSVDLPWHEYVFDQQTLVFYMGLTSLSEICSQLMKAGKSSNTQIALIEKGTTLNQTVYTGTLETMVEKMAKTNVSAPTLIIVGPVVALHQSLSWFGINR